MTIFVPNPETSNTIALNGDFGGYNHYRLQLISDYTNKELEPASGLGSMEWLFELWFINSNERYTEWTLTSILPVPAAGQYSGFYSYNLYGTMTDADRFDPFVPEDWTILHTGLCKLVTTNEFNKFGTQYDTYVSPNDNAESYVIYNL